MTTVFVGLAHISSNLRSKCSTASGEVKDLADGTKAVGLFNLGDREQMVTAQPPDLGFSGKGHVRHLWRHQDLEQFTGELHALVAPHGVVLVTFDLYIRPLRSSMGAQFLAVFWFLGDKGNSIQLTSSTGSSTYQRVRYPLWSSASQLFHTRCNTR